MVAKIPADSPDYPQGLLLLVQAYRGEQNYPETLRTLAQLEGKIPPGDFLMEKARTLEAMGDKSAVTLYQEIINRQTRLPGGAGGPGPSSPVPGQLGGGL